MASIWNWIHEQQLNGTPEQEELAEMFDMAMESYNTDNEQAKGHLVQLRALADRYNEPWWAMLAEHWRLQILIHNTSETDAALDIAVRCAIETRKDKYRAFPQRVCLHEDLVDAYKHKDPIGYEAEIRDAIRYMENEAAESAECRHCIKGLQYGLEEELGNYKAAFDGAMDAAGFADSRNQPHHGSAALLDMCAILHRGMVELSPNQLEAIAGWAEGADDYYKWREERGDPKPRNRARCAMWQAFALRALRREDDAKRFFQNAVVFAAQTDAVPGDGYTQAAVAYHEAAGESDKALAVVEHTLGQLTGKGETWAEARWLWERCRLRVATGQWEDTDLHRAMTLTTTLKKPALALPVLTGGTMHFGTDGESDAATNE